MPPTISVIIPVHNGEKTLARCLNSLTSQSFADFECVVVDDGSTDGTAALLKDYTAKDARITAHTLASGGVSRAKNTGMSKAQGAYLAFLDCDDILEPTALETLHGLIETTKADVAVGHLIHEDEAGKPLPASPALPADGKDPLVMSAAQAVQTVFEGQPFGGHLHGKLLRAEKLQGLRYREDVSIYEDMLFLIAYLQLASKVAYTPVVVHHYVIHGCGAMAAPFSQRKASSLTACQAMERLVQLHFPASLPAAGRFAFQNALWCLQDYLASPPATRREPWARAARREACQLIRSRPLPKGLPPVQRLFGLLLSLGWPLFFALYQGPYRFAKNISKS